MKHYVKMGKASANVSENNDRWGLSIFDCEWGGVGNNLPRQRCSRACGVGLGAGRRVRKFAAAMGIAALVMGMGVTAAVAAPGDWKPPTNWSTTTFEEHLVKDAVTPEGTTINLFDYSISPEDQDEIVTPSNTLLDTGINGNTPDGKVRPLKFTTNYGKSQNDMNKYTSSAMPHAGIVGDRLVNGYPAIRRGDVFWSDGVKDYTTTEGDNLDLSLKYLFDASWLENDNLGTYKKAYRGVKNLLQIDQEGYYYYDCTKNFACFDEGSNSFNLYDSWAVRCHASGTYPDGQFFPFNLREQVFDTDEENTGFPWQVDGRLISAWIKADDRKTLNHLFGMTMTTNFKQTKGGLTEHTNRPITYEFSGDDDVWIFVDGVLVADLGGVHDACGTRINFSTGAIEYFKPPVNEGDHETTLNVPNAPTTLKAAFERAGKTQEELNELFNGDTFADDTIHRLNFYFLERAGNASNCRLKFNLVEVPTTGIKKVDQTGNAVMGAEFALFGSNEDYALAENAPVLATGTTDANGNLYLTSDDGAPIPFGVLAREARTNHFVLRELSAPEGYRIVDDIHIEYAPKTDVARTVNHWETGAFSVTKEFLTAPEEFSVMSSMDGSGTTHTVKVADGEAVLQLPNGDPGETGALIAVALRRTSGGSSAQGAPSAQDPASAWKVVYGSALNGKWNVTENTMAGFAALKEAIAKGAGGADPDLKQGVWTFGTNQQAQLRANIEQLPGDVADYYFLNKDNPRYALAVYFTTAKDSEGNLSLANITADNTYVVDPSHLSVDGGAAGTGASRPFSRMFATTFEIPDMKNRLIVQKLDKEGNPISAQDENDPMSATFALYRAGDVTVDPSTGVATVNDGASALKSLQTRDVKRADGAPFDVIGGGAFEGMLPGTYYVLEAKAPAGYQRSPYASKVIVDNTGVYASAGTSADGISVLRGVGTLAGTMKQFATEDDLDSTLSRIVAHPSTKAEDPADSHENLAQATWQTVGDEDAMHLLYGSTQASLEYGPDSEVDPDGKTTTEVHTGWSKLDIRQCREHGFDKESATDLAEKSLNDLFSGTTTVCFRDAKIGLAVSKVVDGRDGVSADALEGAQQKDFSFTAVFASEDGAPLANHNLTFGKTMSDGTTSQGQAITDAEGGFSFTLRHGERILFTGLPEGTRYIVVEEDPAVPGLGLSGVTCTSITVNGADVDAEALAIRTASGQIVADEQVEFTNTLEAPEKPIDPDPDPKPDPDPDPDPKPDPDPDPDPKPDPDPSPDPNPDPSPSPNPGTEGDSDEGESLPGTGDPFVHAMTVAAASGALLLTAGVALKGKRHKA